MAKVEGIKLIVDYTHNVFSCSKHKHKIFVDLLPRIIVVESSGFYKEKEEDIEESLGIDSKSEIIQLLAIKSLNLLQLKKILKYSYSTIHKHIKNLRKLRLVKIRKSKSEKGKVEKRVELDKRVKVIPLASHNKEITNAVQEQMRNSDKGRREFNDWLESEVKNIAEQPTIRNSTRKS